MLKFRSKVFLLLPILVLGLLTTGTADEPSMGSDSKPSVDSSLRSQLEARAAKTRSMLSEDKRQFFINDLEQLRATGIEEQALKKGDIAPAFTLKNSEGESVSLDRELASGPVILMFYRGGWCPYCNLTLKAYQQMLPEFEKLNARLIAISPEPADHAQQTRSADGLQFQVLSDTTCAVGKQFGIVFEMSDALNQAYQGFGIDVAGHNRTDKRNLPLPATYIIGEGRKILYAYIDVDYKKRAEPADLLKVLSETSSAANSHE